MTTFVSKLLENTKNNESPTSFWKWAGYSAIASVLRDNCFRSKKNGIVYPNIYTLFVAPSSGHRKNSPIDLCEALVTKVGNTKSISGRSSIQGMMDEIVRGETSRNGTMPIKPGCATFFAPELSAGIVSDPQAVKILTDLYDYKSNAYKNLLRSGPNFTIPKIVLSMLAGTNLDISKDFLTSIAIRGGLIARTFVITPDEFRKPFSELDDIPDKNAENIFEACSSLLKCISELKGEFNVEECARDEYRRWYNPWREGYERRQDPSGIIGRIHTSIVKIGMILAANDLTMNICKKHIEEAIIIGLKLLPNYNIFTMSNGRSIISEAGGIVLQELFASQEFKMSRRMLLMNHWNDFEGELLDKVVATLEQGGLIRQVIEGTTVNYQLTQKCIDKMREGE